MREGKEGWHLDKKVTLSVIAAVLLNALSTVWWAARVDAAVTNHEARISINSASIAQLSQQQGNVNEKLAGIQEGQKYQSDILKDLRDEVRSVYKKGPAP